jgi:hypothetical protein
MTHTKLTALLCTLTATVATAVLAGAAASHADVRSRAGTPANHPTHFAGFPAVGVKASTPTTGTLVISLMPTEGGSRGSIEWNVYADGRIIWQKWNPSRDATVVPNGTRRLDTGYVQQRLTLQGVQLLQSKILATGLFDHDLWLVVGKHPVLYQVRVGDRMVTVQGLPFAGPSRKEPFTAATPDQTRALAWIAALVADPAGSLPTSVWADPQIRAFVPSHYEIGFDRGSPDISKLPPPAGKVLSHYIGCRILTTDHARALLQAFVEAGIASDNHARGIGFGLPGPSYLFLSPAIPAAANRNSRC